MKLKIVKPSENILWYAKSGIMKKIYLFSISLFNGQWYLCMIYHVQGRVSKSPN